MLFRSFSDEQRATFVRLKAALSSIASLSVPRYDRSFIIQTDASDYAVGACLAQLDDNGSERPIAYASAKLTDVQRRWSVIEKESYAVIFALQKFDHIVFFSKINLFVDHNPLIHIVNGNPRSAKLTRWALFLQNYDIDIHYRAGPLNKNADCLSRLI